MIQNTVNVHAGPILIVLFKQFEVFRCYFTLQNDTLDAAIHKQETEA